MTPIPQNRASNEASGQGWILAALGVVLALQIELIWNRPVNWDEFFHLTEAHAFARGELTELFQVFYARSLFWLAWLGIDPIDQIRVARLFMLGCEAVTCAAIVAMGERLAGRTAAMMGALAYLSAGYVLQHGVSFRADPMLAASLMGALWILLRARLNGFTIAAASALTGLAVLISIKLVLFAPAFAAVAWFRWDESTERRRLLLQGLAFAGLSLAFAALFTALSSLTLAPHEAVAGRDAGRSLSSAGTMMFNLGLFPRWPYLVGALGTAPLLALFLLRTFGVLRSGSCSRRNAITAWLLIAPLGCVAFYANSFPYFYAFILAPVAVALSLGIAEMLQRLSARVLAAALVVLAALSSLATPRPVLLTQHEVIGAVRTIFPEPVEYFDFPGMIPEFRKANFFMTVWGTRKYWEGLEPSFAEIMAERSVPLLLLNNQVLLENQHRDGGSPLLRQEDRQALREGYVEHWGPVWVAGRQFPATGAPVTNFTIHAPGAYTLEGTPARIDGKPVAAGQVVTLARGAHRFERLGPGTATLRWGRHLARPVRPFSGARLFRDF